MSVLSRYFFFHLSASCTLITFSPLSRCSLKDVVTSLRDKLCLNAEEHFSLVLEHVKSLKRNKLTLLDPQETLARVRFFFILCVARSLVFYILFRAFIYFLRLPHSHLNIFLLHGKNVYVACEVTIRMEFLHFYF